MVLETAGTGLKVAVETVMADGPLKWGYTTMRDGKDAPVTGNPFFDTAAGTLANPHESTIVYKKAGKTVSTSKVVIAKDGKTMTVTSTGTNAKGEAVNNVAHYTKQ